MDNTAGCKSSEINVFVLNAEFDSDWVCFLICCFVDRFSWFVFCIFFFSFCSIWVRGGLLVPKNHNFTLEKYFMWSQIPYLQNINWSKLYFTKKFVLYFFYNNQIVTKVLKFLYLNIFNKKQRMNLFMDFWIKIGFCKCFAIQPWIWRLVFIVINFMT